MIGSAATVPPSARHGQDTSIKLTVTARTPHLPCLLQLLESPADRRVMNSQMGCDLTDPIAVLFIRSDDAFFSLPCKDPLQRWFSGVSCARGISFNSKFLAACSSTNSSLPR